MPVFKTSELHKKLASTSGYGGIKLDKKQLIYSGSEAEFKPAARPDPTKNGLKDKAASIGNAAGRLLLGGTAKLINQGLSEAKQTAYTASMMAGNATHNTEAVANANKASKAEYKKMDSGKGGLFDAGTATTGKDMQKGDLKTGARKIGGTTLESAAELVPVAKGFGMAKDGAGLARTAVKAGAYGAAAGLVGGAGESLVKGKFDAKAIAKDAALGGATGAVGAVIGHIVGKGAAKAADSVTGETAAPTAKAATKDLPAGTTKFDAEATTIPRPTDHIQAHLDELDAKIAEYSPDGPALSSTTGEHTPEKLASLVKERAATYNELHNRMKAREPLVDNQPLQDHAKQLAADFKAAKTPKEKADVSKQQAAMEAEQGGLASLNSYEAAHPAPLDVRDPHVASHVDAELTAIDHSLPGERATGKVNALTDYFRTPTAVLKKLGLKDTADLVQKSFENYRTDLAAQSAVVRHWQERVGNDKGASERIFKWLDGDKSVQLQGEEAKVAPEIKDYMASWADRLDLPKDGRVSDYITHLFDKDLKGKGNLDVNLQAILDKKGKQGVYNPFTKNHRTDAKGYKQDVFAALDAYVKRGTRQVNMSPALKATADAAQGVDERTAKYLLSLNKAIDQRPQEIDKFLNDAVEGATGGRAGAQGATTAMKAWRNTVYRATLGLNVGSAVRNLTQASNTFAELGTRNTVTGYAKLVRSFASKEGNRELQDMGVLDDKLFMDNKEMSRIKSGLDKIDKGIWFMFNTAEHINRGAAYYGAKNLALKKGMEEGAAREYASKMVAKTQFKFNEIETPLAFRSQTAKTALQFQSFGVKQTELLGGWLKGAAQGDKASMAMLARYIGSNIAMVSAVGSVTGIKLTDMIPSLMQFKGVSSPLSTAAGLVKEGVTGKDQYGNDFTTTDAEGNKKRDNGKLAADIFKKGAPLVVPGGTQAKKTIQGVAATTSGRSKTNAGGIRFLAPTDTASKTQAALFGTSPMKASQDFYNGGKQPLTKRQSDSLDAVPPEHQQAIVDFYQTMQGGDNKTAVGKKVKAAVDAGQFEKARRLAGEHNAMVNQEVGRLRSKVGGIPEDFQKYIDTTYMINYDYYESRAK